MATNKWVEENYTRAKIIKAGREHGLTKELVSRFDLFDYETVGHLVRDIQRECPDASLDSAMIEYSRYEDGHVVNVIQEVFRTEDELYQIGVDSLRRKKTAEEVAEQRAIKQREKDSEEYKLYLSLKEKYEDEDELE